MECKQPKIVESRYLEKHNKTYKPFSHQNKGKRNRTKLDGIRKRKGERTTETYEKMK